MVKDLIHKYEMLIDRSAVDGYEEEKMYELLDKVEDAIMELENKIEEQIEIKASLELPTNAELIDDFNYSCRMV